MRAVRKVSSHGIGETEAFLAGLFSGQPWHTTLCASGEAWLLVSVLSLPSECVCASSRMALPQPCSARPEHPYSVAVLVWQKVLRVWLSPHKATWENQTR